LGISVVEANSVNSGVLLSWKLGVALKMTVETIWLAVLAAFLWGCVWWLATRDGLLSTRRLRRRLSRSCSWITVKVLALLAATRQPELRDKAYDEVIDEDWARQADQ
jgi:hypothetical protein